jgi:hypothetical protein
MSLRISVNKAVGWSFCVSAALAWQQAVVVDLLFCASEEGGHREGFLGDGAQSISAACF